MRKVAWITLLLLNTMLAATVTIAQNASKGAVRHSTRAEIARALSAAPASIAEGAAVVLMDDKGTITQLRAGHNGWTCMPADPGTPVGYPVCLDRNGFDWFQAAMAGKAPDATKVGYSYMLQGGSVWSTLDPAATKLPAGQKRPITLPPHIMILNAKIAKESGFPLVAHPDTHQPFILYGDTPYAILIIPVQ